MKSDKSRDTFRREKHYSSVRLQQGRVLTDADWNEQSDVIQHRNEITSQDVIGQTGVPVPPDGFQIFPFTSFTDAEFPVEFEISPGRIYVDGVLGELEPVADNQPQRYIFQPDPFFDPAEVIAEEGPADLSLAKLPKLTTSGMVLVYADIWERHIGALEDSFIRETALGGPDTATRAQTVVQIKVINLGDKSSPLSDADRDAAMASLEPVSIPKLSARAEPLEATDTPCIIPESAGFTRLENQLYRVEIHTGGLMVDNFGAIEVVGDDHPTFKWSRDNGSVVAKWVDDPQPAENTLKVELPTRDETRGFAEGQWVELTDDRRELSGVSGILVRLTHVDGDILTYDPNTLQDPLGLADSTTPPVRVREEFHPKIRRWDMPAASSGPLEVPEAAQNEEVWVDLEAGVQVRFTAGEYRPGDYWTIPARTIGNAVEFGQFRRPEGIKHHYTCLASFPVTGNLSPVQDCRKRFHPLTDLNPVVPTDEPKSGQYRYYLVDNNSGMGNDGAGRVGVDDNDAVEAYNNAIPFATLAKALENFPRDGRDSYAIILLEAGEPEYGGRNLEGVHGYRKLVIRGTHFATDDLTFPLVPQDELTEIRSGGVEVPLGPFAPAARQNPQPPLQSNELEVSTSLPGDADAHVGKRIRFIGDNSENLLFNFTSMILASTPATGSGSGAAPARLTLSSTLPVVPGTGDLFVLEEPFAKIDFLTLGFIGSSQFSGFAVSASGASLSLVGLNVTGRLDVYGPFVGEVAFCRFNLVGIQKFGYLNVSGSFVNEVAQRRELGMGAHVDADFELFQGELVGIQNSAVIDLDVEDVEEFRVHDGFFSETASIAECDRFSVGRAKASGSPRLVRLGVNTSAAAVDVTDSNGAIAGALFETPFPTEDPVVNLDLVKPSVVFSGTGKSLKLDDVAILNGGGQNPSGILLDARGAVASVFDYTTGPGLVVSGLIMVAGRTFFRPFELNWTDKIDGADNRYLSPALPSTGGSGPTAFGMGRTYVQKGPSLQTDVTKNQGGSDTFGVERYHLTQYVGDGTLRVRMANARYPGNPSVIDFEKMLASIVGVIQQQVLPSENVKAFAPHVTSGYTLIALAGDITANTPLPAPVYLAGDNNWGRATLVIPSDPNIAPIRLGIMVKFIGFLGDGHRQERSLGLINLQLAYQPPVSQGD
jgi:hypothetical protein